jgi:predicted dehydrogenase
MTDRRGARPRLGFAGLGWIGQHRLRSLAAAGTADIVALADPVEACRRAALAIAPAAEAVDTFAALLARDLDGVVIATPNALHVEQTLHALETGRAVFCQKPLARTAAETARLVAAARAADRDLDIDLSYRHVRAMRRVRDCVRSGALGAVFAVELVFHNAYGPDKAWFDDPRLAGGGCVLDLGIHLVDLALWTLDFPAVRAVESRLFAAGRRVAPGDAVEDFAVVQLDLDDGIVVRMTCSWRIAAGCDAVIEASFYGPQGRATLRNRNGSFYDFAAEHARGTTLEVLDDAPDAWGGGAITAWAARLAAGGRYRNVDHFVTVAGVLDAVYGRPRDRACAGEAAPLTHRLDTPALAWR